MLEAVWLIPALPLTGFAVLLLAGRRLGDPKAGWLATAMMGGSFIATVVVFVGLLDRSEEHRSYVHTLFSWVPAGRLNVDVGFLVDPLSMAMALFVTGVATLIHLYSIGYMHGDDRYATFFVYLNLFAFSMLMLVLADNFLLTFLGWEGVGACSYFLVSFWFERPAAATAGKKAFIVNRVGDFGFMVAMFLIFATFGSLQYADVLGPGLTVVSSGTAAAIALLLFLGATGKSAQLPLYIWLPDAMEGPTPVSALIHAATMVTAGVFLMVRINPILGVAGDTTLSIIAWVGVLTAFFAATIACAQNDIKKVLAYSTVSQLGYMFLAVGCGAYVAAVFHMITHAFFKALLFLGAGSVIHGMHDEQDMKKMGGLRKWLPITSSTFIVGWLAISGVPPFAGFWSKDDILANAWDKSLPLWIIGLITAGLTAYYMGRQVFLVFFGDERWKDGAEAHGAHGDMKPHESPWTMWVPLVVLAVGATFGGLLNLPFHGWEFLHSWLEPVLGDRLHELTIGGDTELALALTAVALVFVGMGIAWLVYLGHKLRQEAMEPLVLRRAWYVDPLYASVVEKPGRVLADFSAYVFDKRIIDGAVNGVAGLVRLGGGRLRSVQTGYVRNYALVIAAGAVLLLAYMVSRVGI
ncbi:MAG TPA: NADH-quinone oxidoreductase subunit L [Acidimicrobiales bacterium]|nr:NADH-quinone oxidoreductase subunit L [Acidimicrobiales bacterium]